MSFYRALSKSLLRTMAAERAVVPWPGSPGPEEQRSPPTNKTWPLKPWENPLKPWENVEKPMGKAMGELWKHRRWSDFRGRIRVAYFLTTPHSVLLAANSFGTLMLRYHQEMQMTPFEQFCKERGLGQLTNYRLCLYWQLTNCQVLIQCSSKSGRCSFRPTSTPCGSSMSRDPSSATSRCLRG